MRLLILLTVLLLSASTTLAQNELKYTAPAAPATPDPARLLTRLVLITGLALAVCVGILWLIRRIQRVSMGATALQDRIRIEGSLPLDRRSSLHLLRVDGNTIAVTIDATGLRSMTLLTESFDTVLAATGLSSTEQRNAHS